MKTEELLSSAGETFGYAKIYFEQQVDFFHLEASKRLAKTTSNLVTLTVISLLSVLVIIFLSIAIALLLGSWIGSYGVAFLIITGFYLLAVLLIIFFKDKFITIPITKLIVKNMLD